MSATRVRLTTTSAGRWLLLAVGYFVGGVFGWSSAGAVVAPDQPWWLRALAVVFTGLILSAVLALPLSVRGRLRWLEVDGDGLRLRRGSGATFTDLRWTELAAVGVLVDPVSARHAVRGNGGLTRVIEYRMPPWLELVPADDVAVAAHPELGPLVPDGDGWPARWIVQLNQGWAGIPDVGAAVTRWRPELWWGEREGTVPARRGPVAGPPLAAGLRERVARRAGVRVGGRVVPVIPARRTPSARPPVAGPPSVVELPQPPVWPALAGLVVAVVALVVAMTAGEGDFHNVLIALVIASLVGWPSVRHLARRRHPTRLEADHAALRLVRGPGGSVWRVPWSDVGGIRLECRGRRATLVVRPAGPDAVAAHPELRRWSGADWRLPLGPVGSPAEVQNLVVTRRPDLWRPT